MNIVTWNVNGIRAVAKNNLFDEIKKLDADVFCFQETKAQVDQVEEALAPVEGYHLYANHATKKGYSGTAILCKKKPVSVSYDIGKKIHDDEGRVTCVELKKYYIVNVYVPNSGAGLKRLEYRETWDKAFANYLNKLQKDKPVIVTGDFNVAHAAIDLANPKSNYNKTSGYTQKEIDGMSNILKKGFVDAYRSLYPEEIIYTYWSLRTGARARNAGWRIDYFLVSESLMPKVKDVVTHNDIMGSDHCPVELVLKR